MFPCRSERSVELIANVASVVAAALLGAFGSGCGPRQAAPRPEAPPIEELAAPAIDQAETPPEVPPFERAMASLEKAGLAGYVVIDARAAAQAREAGLDEEVIVGLVEGMLADCLAADGRCEDLRVSGGSADAQMRQVAETLIGLLGQVGTPRSLPLLLRLDARGVYRAGMARETMMTEAMLKTVAAYPCPPPGVDEVSAAREQIEGFAVFEVRGRALAARRATAEELDDLAYFLAAVGDSGGEVGRATETGDGSWLRPGPENLSREQLLERLEAAQREGRLEVVAATARAYLQSFGYPGAIHTEKAHEYAWGGARYSYVMRDLAEALEALGQLDEAAHLYRRANPGGGACGTSYWSIWRSQVRGVIRCEERRHRCHAAIPERLLGLLEIPSEAYGTERLAAAGFDVARLFRGALVTMNRDAARSELDAALTKAPPSLRARAQRRLVERGLEDWERRVYALEGLADVAGREALPVLIAATNKGARSVRLRAIAALGKLAEAPPYDPCDPNILRGRGYGSNVWERAITDLGGSCETLLSPDESAVLTSKILKFTGDIDPEIREVTAKALGSIASPVAVPHLEKLLADPHQPEGSQTCKTGPDGVPVDCRARYPVREAAREALDHIAVIRASRQM